MLLFTDCLVPPFDDSAVVTSRCSSSKLGYAVGDKIANSTFDRAGYNGTLIVTGAAANTWTAAIASDPGGAGSGGTTSRISNVTLVDYIVEWMQ